MFEIIPAIDLRGGRCVRLFQGDYARETVFGEDPVAMARYWAALGARRLHVVDLDGAREGRSVQLPLVGKMVQAVQIPIELGGGLRTLADLRSALAVGVERLVIGTAALGAGEGSAGERFRAACRKEMSGRVIVGLDARAGKLAVRGWTQTTQRDTFEFARVLRDEGFGRVIYTDISRDGALSGPNVEHLTRLLGLDGLAVIASGGIRSIEDLQAVASAGAEGAIVGQALYSGDLDLVEAQARLAASAGASA
jgi:phosphoribosylformimino-5-aminoimidazole carboxamide ribotide isomerase